MGSPLWSHLLRVLIGYLSAVCVATITVLLTIPVLGSSRTGWGQIEVWTLFSGLLSIAFLVLLFSFKPAVLAIAVAEFWPVRRKAFFLIAGGIAPSAPMLISMIFGGLFAELYLSTAFFAAFSAVPGIAAGFVYWWIAGRFSGNWRGGSFGGKSTSPAP
jgi:hypothetical protein